MMKYRLGLDLGTNSIGWAVLQSDDHDELSSIAATGVRVFSDGREPKSNSTLKATRRDARSMRRRRDRYLQRRTFLLDELTKCGLFPEDSQERSKLQKLNPLKLRAMALETELPLHHIGRALFHLNQRRGFKSNRKDKSEEVTTGKISQSSLNLLKQMDLLEDQDDIETNQNASSAQKKVAREKAATDRQSALERLKERKNLSFGSYLWEERHQKGLPTRARPSSDGKLYEVYPTRELLEDEFNKIWDAQAQYHPTQLSDALRVRLFDVIFFQRKLKAQPLGKCVYFPDEDRVYRAMPSFQRYRIYQEVNNLEWRHGIDRVRLIDDPFDRNRVIELLEQPSVKKNPSDRNALVRFNVIRKELKKREAMLGDCEFNLESERRKGIDGNQTSNVMQHEDYVGPKWHDWSLDKQDKFISTILDDKLDDQEVCDRLIKQFGLTPISADMCKNAKLVDGTANISVRAARILTEIMTQDMLIQSEAVQRASKSESGFRSPYTSRRRGELLNRLPYYGEAVQGHVIPGTGYEADHQARIGMVSNPTVHIAMNQLRLVVNELISRFGNPISISIELARELPVGKEGRAEITKAQSINQKRNEDYNKTLDEYGQKKNRDNRNRIRLWEEQGKRCVFTGKSIGMSELLSAAVEIEHLIPFSKSLDDGLPNKVVCLRQANRDKGNRTPFEAFSSSPGNYDWSEISSRVGELPKSKQWRFDDDALEKWHKNSEGDFSSRHLNDTRYIGRLAKEYLENICEFNKIDVVTGRLTGLLRTFWGLNSVLSEIRNEPNGKKTKNRNDHRHHAIDAIVVGMTSRSVIQRVSTEANHAEELFEFSRLFPRKDGTSAIEPWHGFRRDVTNAVSEIVVSHKVRRKDLRDRFKHSIARGVTDGQLHNDTAFGIIDGPDKNELSKVVVRRPVEYFMTKKRLESVRDEYLKKKFLAAFAGDPNQGVINLARKKGIRSLRATESRSVIPMVDRNGTQYKAYQGDSNWGIEIFSYPKGCKKFGNWEGVVISRFEANQPEFRPGFTYRPHPAAKLVMRLQINDCIEIEDAGKIQILRIQKIRKTGQMALAPLDEANVDTRNRDKNDSFQYWYKTANSLRELKARKIHISPTGIISPSRTLAHLKLHLTQDTRSNGWSNR